MEEHHLIRLTQMILLLGFKTIYTLMQKIAFGNGLIAKENKTKNKNKNTHTKSNSKYHLYRAKYMELVFEIFFVSFFGTIPTSDMWLKETFVDIIDVLNHWRFWDEPDSTKAAVYRDTEGGSLQNISQILLAQ